MGRSIRDPSFLFCWVLSFANFTLDVPLGNSRLETFALNFGLRILHLENFAWGPSLVSFSLGTFAWDLLLGTSRMVSEVAGTGLFLPGGALAGLGQPRDAIIFVCPLRRRKTTLSKRRS